MINRECGGAPCDPECRDRVERAVLERVRAGPAPLAEVILAAEAAIADCDDQRAISPCLQEMARRGVIVLRCDGRRWMVVPGPHGLTPPPSPRWFGRSDPAGASVGDG